MFPSIFYTSRWKICIILKVGQVKKFGYVQPSRMFHVDGLVQGCSNSIANAVKLLQFCTKPSMYWYILLQKIDLMETDDRHFIYILKCIFNEKMLEFIWKCRWNVFLSKRSHFAVFPWPKWRQHRHNDVTWASWQITGNSLFRAITKKIQSSTFVALCEDRFPSPRGQKCGKCFYIVTSSYLT